MGPSPGLEMVNLWMARSAVRRTMAGPGTGDPIMVVSRGPAGRTAEPWRGAAGTGLSGPRVAPGALILAALRAAAVGRPGWFPRPNAPEEPSPG
jgi:hypothetical protein